ncbi:uncharacterized protein LOC112083508 [Eutrema salsugineum]|uniref:uncharacterized protein LOC112083508 n=1 Tax=Eutrema salsugineum TaxID=72664 RepID=UPI000CECF189|nr:uncharacterized protein LOC112083508 [Eutrema salsugineum]
MALAPLMPTYEDGKPYEGYGESGRYVPTAHTDMMNLLRRGGYSFQPASRTPSTSPPPGSTGSVSSTAQPYIPASLAELMNAPARLSMPHLHPERLDGALWFDIHPKVTKDICKTWKSNFWGPWWNYSMVPQEKKDMWWASFVQLYYWDKEHEDAKKLAGLKPDFISQDDWYLMLKMWETPKLSNKCKTNSKNRKANPHNHTAGAKKTARIEHEMTIAAGGVRPSIPELVRKTHTRKDGTFVDKRAESLIKEAETLAAQRAAADSGEIETAVELSSELLTAAYLEKATTKNGHIYGPGSSQFINVDPKVSPATAFARNIALEERITSIEASVKENFSNMKKSIEDNKDSHDASRRALNVLLQINGIDPVTLMPLTPTSRSNGSSSTGALHTSHSPVNFGDLPNHNLPGIFEEN